MAAASSPAPLGAVAGPEGVNFSVYARHATGVELLLFADLAADQPEQSVPLMRTGDYWHALVPGIGPGQVYAYRAHGPARETSHSEEPADPGGEPAERSGQYGANYDRADWL